MSKLLTLTEYIIYFLAIFSISAVILDASTTYIAINFLGLREQNPLAFSFMGFYGLLPMTLAFGSFIIIVESKVSRKLNTGSWDEPQHEYARLHWILLVCGFIMTVGTVESMNAGLLNVLTILGRYGLA